MISTWTAKCAAAYLATAKSDPELISGLIIARMLINLNVARAQVQLDPDDTFALQYHMIFLWDNSAGFDKAPLQRRLLVEHIAIFIPQTFL